MYLPGLHFLKKRVDMARLRYKMRLSQDRRDLRQAPGAIFLLLRSHQRIPHMKNSYDVIHILVIYRKTGIYRLRENKGNCLIQCHGCIQSHHVRPVRHNVAGLFVTELKNIGYHFCLAGFQNSLLMAFIYHKHNIFFCHIVFGGIGIYSHGTQYQ